MKIRLAFQRWHLGVLAALFMAALAAAVPAGPTLRLSINDGCTNPTAAFMYFVPLISPEPVVSYSTRSSQSVAVSPPQWKFNQNSFVATCDIRFRGNGAQRTVFDLNHEIRRNERKLKAGGQLAHQLKSILVEGPGAGSIEIEGSIANGIRTVEAVRLHFDSDASPVTIDLCDIRWMDGRFQTSSEVVARVSNLTFRRVPGVPKMEVTVTSIKDKNASDSLWQNFKGRVKGMAANMLIPPLPVEAVGHQAMLDFGRALITGASTFTFPQARSLLPFPGH